jgi:hypothetical protein
MARFRDGPDSGTVGKQIPALTLACPPVCSYAAGFSYRRSSLFPQLLVVDQIAAGRLTKANLFPYYICRIGAAHYKSGLSPSALKLSRNQTTSFSSLLAHPRPSSAD